MKLVQPRMVRSNGKGMWKMPARKAFNPQGITHGATVLGPARPKGWGPMSHDIRGQLWSQVDPKAYGGRVWWVVDELQQAWLMHEESMTVLGQCIADVPLEDVG